MTILTEIVCRAHKRSQSASKIGLAQLTWQRHHQPHLEAALAQIMAVPAQLVDRLHQVVFEGVDRSIDAHVKNLRRKLEPNPSEPRYVLTVFGVGYKFADEA